MDNKKKKLAQGLSVYWFCGMMVFVTGTTVRYPNGTKLYLIQLGTLIIGSLCGYIVHNSLMELNTKIDKAFYLIRISGIVLLFSLMYNFNNKSFSGYIENNTIRCGAAITAGAVSSAMSGTAILSPAFYVVSIISGGLYGSAMNCH